LAINYIHKHGNGVMEIADNENCGVHGMVGVI